MRRNEHNKNVGSSIERTDDRINSTSEVFTPMKICEEMIRKMPEEYLKDPKSTFLDNSAGSGNFIVALLNRLKEYHTEKHIVDNMLYAVELMDDKHKELCDRVGVPTTHPHYVCHDALTYDYTFGELQGVEKYMGGSPKVLL